MTRTDEINAEIEIRPCAFIPSAPGSLSCH